ncbi:uncharacterized protein METZ01_LOCUS413310, partial [marine metagenome]
HRRRRDAPSCHQRCRKHQRDVLPL